MKLLKFLIYKLIHIFLIKNKIISEAIKTSKTGKTEHTIYPAEKAAKEQPVKEPWQMNEVEWDKFQESGVIHKDTGKDLPEGFQTSEFLLEHGFLDFIAPRKELKDKINLYLDLIQNQPIR